VREVIKHIGSISSADKELTVFEYFCKKVIMNTGLNILLDISLT
jgi:hypothetical protein